MLDHVEITVADFAPSLVFHCPRQHPGHYGAFVRDPDGHNVEAVCHHPE